MSRLNRSLLAVFFIQCAMVAAVYWPAPQQTDKAAARPLAPFEAAILGEIQIDDSRGNEAVLLRNGEQWILPDLAGLPADQAMVDNLIRRITHANTGRPVAHTVAARQRFQVAAYHFQRRLTLIGNHELLGTIYLGSSPGFRKVHARNDAHASIYSIAFNTFDAPTDSAAWLDKTLLQISQPVAISTDAFALQRQDQRWQTGDGVVTEASVVAPLLAALKNLQVDGIADEDMQRSLASATANMVFQVETGKANIGLEFYQLDGQHYIHCSAHALFFSLSAYDYDRFALLAPGPQHSSADAGDPVATDS